MYYLYKTIELEEDLYIKEHIDQMLDNTFHFTRKYDMEHCAQEVNMYPIEWDLVPFGDDEWKWVLHRMDYCVDLCIESIKTDDPKYAEKAKSFIFDFIENNSENERQTKFRTLDSGIRLIVWSQCIEYLEYLELLSSDERHQIEQSIKWQVKHLVIDYQEYHDFSNWGFMQAVGVLNSAHITSIEKEYLEFYEKRFSNHLKTQFFDCGIQWEQSSVYTMEVALRMSQLNNPLYKTAEYYQVLITAAKALYALGNFDDKTILLGDGDRIDTLGFIQEIAFLTQNKELNQLVVGTKLREEVYFKHGDSAYVLHTSQTVESNSSNEYLSPDSGFYSYKTPGNYFSFQNGTLGGGHGHFDNLHINYSFNGEKILVDSGRYSYVDSLERKVLKSTESHNGIKMTNDTYKYLSSWDSKGKLQYTPLSSSEQNGVKYFESSVHTDNDSAFRKVLYLPNGELVIIDNCFRDFEVNFVCDYESNVEQVAGEYLIGNTKANFWGAESIVENCYISPKYNELEKTKKIKLINEQNTIISFFTAKDTDVSLSEKVKIFQVEKYSNQESQIYCYDITGDDFNYCLAVIPFEFAGNNNILKYKEDLILGSVVLIDVNTNTYNIFKR